MLSWGTPYEKTLDTKSPHYESYVQAVKEIIDRGIDRANGKEVEFSNDFSRVRIKDIFVGDTVKTFVKKVNKYLGNK